MFQPGKYVPFEPVHLEGRTWPSKTIAKAPDWVSVDLRDGNQALVVPMNLDEKLRMFRLLTKIGFREIEVGFPASSETELRCLRALIDGNCVPEGVTIQVLVQSRRGLIEKTFDALDGAKDVIVNFYHSVSELQRRVVFRKDKQGIIEIALEGAAAVLEGARHMAQAGVRVRYEYSPESFTGTEPDFAIEICSRVMEALGASPENPVILNLPATVEMSTPNGYADQVEYFCRNLPHPENAVVSIHPHNDRGTAVAAAELALMAGATRVEGTLFGNGERTGNVDLVTLALNMFTQGVNPGLDFSNIRHVREVYESCVKMPVHDRQPYAGDLVFTAFSGSHQDAISKGLAYRRQNAVARWEVPYLPIDPADIGRQYEPVIRINSQSGKGGAAFVLEVYFGYHLPKAMHPDFGAVVKAESDRRGGELSKDDLLALFEQTYLNIQGPLKLRTHSFQEETVNGDEHPVRFEGILELHGVARRAEGSGNGPLSAFLNALEFIGVTGYHVESYHEHAIGEGTDSKAITYIRLARRDGSGAFGAGISSNINLASVRGIVSAINRLNA